MKRDKISLSKFLKRYHTGIENTITCKQLQMVFHLEEARIRKEIQNLRRNGTPICSCYLGYYYPETASDVVETAMRFNKYLVTLSGTSANLIKSASKIM